MLNEIILRGFMDMLNLSLSTIILTLQLQGHYIYIYKITRSLREKKKLQKQQTVPVDKINMNFLTA